MMTGTRNPRKTSQGERLADVVIENGTLKIKLSLLDRALAFHSSFEIPLSHITNAYVSDLESSNCNTRSKATNFGMLKSAGIFANPQGLIFADAGSRRLSRARHPWRALSADRCAVARKAKIPTRSRTKSCAQLPDSGPVD